MSVVLQAWVEGIPWKQQSILLSGLRGPDVGGFTVNVKKVNRWMRMQCQHNADPSKPYMLQRDLPTPVAVCDELEFLTVHFVHHFADALAVIAYNHPELPVAWQATSYHWYIAEELFHFVPEPPEMFVIRHRDKVNDEDDPAMKAVWERMVTETRDGYLEAVQARFG